MNHVEIVAVGDEILNGRILDSNSHWLARAITSFGGEVARCVAVRDRTEEIASEVRAAMARESAVVITTGGLGPTFDDRTLEAIATVLDQPLLLHAKALERVIQKYENLRKEGSVADDHVTPAREKMARLPDGATPLPNPVGAALGVMLEAKGCKLFCLPGVPHEMKAIFDDSLRQRFEAMFSNRFVERNITTSTGDESELVPIINEVMRTVEGVHLKSRPTRFGQDVHLGIRLTASGPDETDLAKRIEQAIKELARLLARHNRTIVEYGMRVESPSLHS